MRVYASIHLNVLTQISNVAVEQPHKQRLPLLVAQPQLIPILMQLFQIAAIPPLAAVKETLLSVRNIPRSAAAAHLPLTMRREDVFLAPIVLVMLEPHAVVLHLLMVM